MDPVQSFDVVSAVARDSEPDPAMMHFVRFIRLGSSDAFLLKSIFRGQFLGFMELPVSEGNGLQVVKGICDAYERALTDLQDCPSGVWSGSMYQTTRIGNKSIDANTRVSTV
jgi:hypothetical protein